MKRASEWISYSIPGGGAAGIPGALHGRRVLPQQRVQRQERRTPDSPSRSPTRITRRRPLANPQDKIKALDAFIAQYNNPTLMPFAYRDLYQYLLRTQERRQDHRICRQVSAVWRQVHRDGSTLDGAGHRAQAYLARLSDKSHPADTGDTDEDARCLRTRADGGGCAREARHCD